MAKNETVSRNEGTSSESVEKRTESSSSGNREFKGDVFSMLMREPKYALQVYNALNHSDYSNPEEIQIITTNHGVSLSVRNDASFMIDRHVNYYEHQSTYSPNMPLRCLIYYIHDLKEFVKYDKKDLYSRKMIPIPTPHFVIFYNGEDKRPETEVMRLSAAFYHQTEEPELEVICTAYNINPSFNEELKEKAGVLYGYTHFVEKVRTYRETEVSLRAAIDRAIDECIEEDILRDFFLENRDEVVKVTDIDMTFETRLAYVKRDSYEEGLEDGRAEGIKEQAALTERERQRADSAEARADLKKARADSEKTRADDLQIELDQLRKQLSMD